jgi:hypothetical protein
MHVFNDWKVETKSMFKHGWLISGCGLITLGPLLQRKRLWIRDFSTDQRTSVLSWDFYLCWKNYWRNAILQQERMRVYATYFAVLILPSTAWRSLGSKYGEAAVNLDSKRQTNPSIETEPNTAI